MYRGKNEASPGQWTVQDRCIYYNNCLFNVLKAKKGPTCAIYTDAMNIFWFCNNWCMCAYPGQ